MVSLSHRILLLLSLVISLASASIAQTKPHPRQIAITHVTVINPGAASVRPDSIVVINDDRITFVSHSAAVPLAKNTRVIDGRGQFLIPGLWDMHVHSAFGDWFPGGRDIILPLFIANGVTGVRDMGGDIPVLFGWREFMDADGLMTYGAHMTTLYRRAASFVDKILKGAPPADLPVELPRFELVINLRTAKALGVTIPPELLSVADDVIQ